MTQTLARYNLHFLKRPLSVGLMLSLCICGQLYAQKDQKIIHYKKKIYKVPRHYVSIGVTAAIPSGDLGSSDFADTRALNATPGPGVVIRGILFHTKHIGLAAEIGYSSLFVNDTKVRFNYTTELPDGNTWQQRLQGLTMFNASAGMVYSFSPIRFMFVHVIGQAGFLYAGGGKTSYSLQVEQDFYRYTRSSDAYGLMLSGLVALRYQSYKRLGFSVSLQPWVAYVNMENHDKFSSDYLGALNDFKWQEPARWVSANVSFSVHYYFVRTYEGVFKPYRIRLFHKWIDL